MKRKKHKIKPKILLKLAKILIAAGLVMWLIYSGRLDFSILFSTPLNLFHLLGILTVLLNMLFQAVRWWWLLRIQNINLSLGHAIQLSWIGQFFSIVLPGAAGGELVRAYYIAKDAPAAKAAGISSVLLDRVLGMYALLWLGIPVMIFLAMSQDELGLNNIKIGLLIILLLIIMSVLIISLWAQPARNLIFSCLPERFRIPLETTIKAYQAYGRDLFACFALSLLASIILMGSFMLASQCIGTPLSWHQIFLVGPLVTIANALPVSPGGIGVAETTASVLFAEFGVETGAMIMIILRLWILILRLPGGLMYVISIRSGISSRITERMIS